MIGESIATGGTSTSFANVFIPMLGSFIGIAITTLIVCVIIMPFAKKLIKYAIEEYNKHKKE